ncbi:MAG: hypothetical protein IID49_12040 [Proteobacteria bacterium]|nr:hypothetical protein [Pseudomonadota bacterium]
MRHRLVLATLFCLAVSLPQTARADFGDCAADGYLGRFPDAPGALGLTCVELFNFTYPTPGGARRMRGIQDISADWAFLPGAPEAVERGARLAAAAFAPLGDFRIDDVTLLILDDAHSTFYSAEREVMAITDGHADPAGGRAGECLITLFMLGRGGDPAELAVTVAHEIFHCLQFASLSTAQMSTVGRGGDWWVEGSAEYFAALAVPGSERFTDRGAPFDAAVAGEVALNAMGHEAVILFYWMHPTSGPSGLMAFMRAMAASGGASAQQAAMRAVLADEEWLDFAEEYSDRAISHPRGGALALNPPGGEVLSFDENETLEFTLAPFVIRLGTVEYDCGEWENTLTPANANVAVQEEGESSWDSYPEEVDAREPPAGRYRIVAMHTESEERSLSIEAERTVVCEPCGGSDRVDACLVGTWFQSGGGAIEWMKAQGIPIVASHSGPRIITYRDDGVYGTDSFAAGLTIRDRDYVGVGEGFLTVAAGRWSAGDGRMAICQDSGMLSGRVTVTTPRTRGTMPISHSAAGQLSLGYTCSESALSTTLDFPGLSPMVTHYTKVPEIVPPVAE